MKKIVIFGLLAFAQVSLGMEEPISPKDLENEYAYFEMLEEVGMAALCGKPWRQYKKEEKKRKEFERGLEKYMGWAKTGATEYAKVYSSAYGLTFAHEFGHWAINQLLLKEKGLIFISPLQFLPLGGAHYRIPISQVIKHFINNPQHIFKAKSAFEQFAKYYWKKNLKDKMYKRVNVAALYAAGPIAGCLASYLLLKGNTLYNEYEKNESDFDSALCETLEKPLFNSSQNFWLQLLVALNIHGQLFINAYPWGNTPTRDGDRMFRVLNIKNTRPLLRKTIGMSLGTLTACALVKSIFDAWKDKF